MCRHRTTRSHRPRTAWLLPGPVLPNVDKRYTAPLPKTHYRLPGLPPTVQSPHSTAVHIRQTTPPLRGSDRAHPTPAPALRSLPPLSPGTASAPGRQTGCTETADKALRPAQNLQHPHSRHPPPTAPVPSNPRLQTPLPHFPHLH